MVNHPNRNSLDAKARRTARRVRLAARKSRDRTTHANNLGGYILCDLLTNAVIVGPNYDLTPEEVIAWCEGLRAEPYGEGSDVMVAPREARLHPSKR